MISTNLENLARIGQLEKVAFSAEVVQRMLASAQQRLRDAAFTQNSHETRFDCAYTAIRVVADIALHLAGFRTSTSKPGLINRKAFPRPHGLRCVPLLCSMI